MEHTSNLPRMTRKSYTGVEELRRQFELRKEAIRRRIAEFARVRPEDHFYELVYGLLTSQSSAVHAGAAVEKLRAARLPDRQEEIAGILREKDSYIRFHNTKAGHI